MARKNVNMREIRHAKIRKKVSGTLERPRLCVFRSLKHIYAQLVDDNAGRTLLTVSTLTKETKGIKANVNIKAAEAVGAAIAKKCIEKGHKKVVFDRSGYLYHGRIKALADAARKAGLDF